MKFFYLFILIFSASAAQGQTLNNFSLKDIGQSMLVVTDGTGKTVNMGLDMENYGSPFFDTEFYPADITLINGQRYENILAKINLLSNEIIFKSDEGKELAILPAIQSVLLKKNGTDILFEYGYPVFEKQNGKTIYQVLAKGEISLLKYYFVQVTEAKPYSSATMLRTIEKFPKLFVYNKNIGLKKAPKTNEEVAEIFKVEKESLIKIIGSNKLKLKKEEDLLKCIELFNQQIKK
ncbi:MAG: hypothetical protein ACKOWO_08760 [Sediminibacterium sp.]